MAFTRNRGFVYFVLSIAALSVAMWLRVQDAKLRVYHADEGVQSYQAFRLVEEGVYRYDPKEHHGPLLYYVTKFVAPLITDESGNLSDFSMRMVPLAFSLATLVLGLWALASMGRDRAMLWALLVGVAPLCVIYGSYYIQESLLALFSFSALYSLFRYFQDRGRGWAVFFGLSLGFMHVTKETAVIHVFAMFLVAGWLARKDFSLRKVAWGKWVLDIGIVAGIVVLLHVLFFSSFGENPQGVWDAFVAFFNYAERSQGAGHEKALFYYFRLLLPQRLEGIRWSELSVLILMLLGSIWTLIRKQSVGEKGFERCMAANGLLLLALYSMIPYKNPWLLLTPYIYLAYPASCAVCGLISNGRDALAARRVSGIASGVLGIVALVWMSIELGAAVKGAVFRFPSSSRNPYLYVHTTPRYERLLQRLNALREQIPAADFSIAVVSPDYSWPLPWHLRDWENVGYWTDVARAPKASISIFDTRSIAMQQDVFETTDFVELHGLRPNTLLTLKVSEPFAKILIQD